MNHFKALKQLPKKAVIFSKLNPSVGKTSGDEISYGSTE